MPFTIPRPYPAFANTTGATISTVQTSATITLAGLSRKIPISIGPGGTLMKNGVALSARGYADNGDTIALRQTASGAAATRTIVKAQLGLAAATYAVTTA